MTVTSTVVVGAGLASQAFVFAEALGGSWGTSSEMKGGAFFCIGAGLVLCLVGILAYHFLHERAGDE